MAFDFSNAISLGSKTTVLKETDRETKHIIETLVGFENGIETNRSSLDKECSQIENEIASPTERLVYLCHVSQPTGFA
jgi:hypothetical protein